jgi:putative endonuclease
MKFVTYILFSESVSKYYTGHTQDMANRLAEHNHGETSSIKTGIPWKIVWTSKFPTRAEAMKMEVRIKKRGASRFLTDVSRGA